jgi:hypothetical protein
MAVPETSMDKDYFSAGRENQVWFSGKVFSVKPETVSEAVNQRPHFEFWRSVLAADSPHVLATAHPHD